MPNTIRRPIYLSNSSEPEPGSSVSSVRTSTRRIDGYDSTRAVNNSYAISASRGENTGLRIEGTDNLVTVRLPNSERGRASTSLKSILGGIQFSGVDWSKVEAGRVEVSMPMSEGRFSLPTNFEDADTVVPANCTAKLTVDIARNSDNSKIKSLEVAFSEELRVLNPASAFRPSEGFFGAIWDAIQDIAGDVLLRGFRVDSEGEIHLEGTIDQPWPMNDLSLGPEVERALLPRLNMEIETISDGNLVRRNAKKQGESVTLQEFLNALGAITEAGRYSLFMKTGATSLSAAGNNLSIVSEESPIVVDITGGVEVGAEGSIHLNIDDNPDKEISSGLGDVNLEGGFTSTADEDDSLRTEGRIEFESRLRGITGSISGTNGSFLPLKIRGPNNLLVGNTKVVVTPNKVYLHNGKVRAKLDAVVGEGMVLDVEGTKLSIDHGRVISDAGWSFEGDSKALRITDGDLELKISANDAHFMTYPVRVRMDGRTELLVNAENIEVTEAGKLVSGEGDLRLMVDPRDERRRDSVASSPIWWKLGYEFDRDGDIRFIPQGNGLEEFVAPFLGIRGRTEALVDPKTPAVGKVGSAALKEHIRELTGAPIRKSSRPEILIDGVMSYPKRLEIIRNARESICLQTLIFKDDQTGKETVRELIKAAQRGVEVRVLIDALGNVEDLEDLTGGKDIYQKLRDGGVELILYKDPKNGPLRDLITELANNPELSELENIGLLADDLPKAMSVLRELAKIALGDGNVSEDTERRIRDILGRVLATDLEGRHTISTAELSTLVAGDEFEMARWLVVLKHFAEMNARWHEKSLIVDGQKAILGGMNIADEYMLGGTDTRVGVLGEQRTAWRDTDVFVEGEVARDAYRAFAKNWKHVSGVELSVPVSVGGETSPPGSGEVEAQFIQHRPSIDGDHHITNLMVENIKALSAGQKCYISNAYFLPVGALEGFKTALQDAAKRGVDVRILTNSSTSSDLPQINQAAIFPYRELLESGVRIFEQRGKRTMHAKTAVFADNTTLIGSWNADNRSASINSENVLAVYDVKTAKAMTRQFELDASEEHAHEITLSELDNIPSGESFSNAIVSIFGHLM